MMIDKQHLIDEAIHKIVERASNCQIQSDVPLDEEQLELLHQLNVFCVQQVLEDIEVKKDPRKIGYMSNQELKLALVALCLSRSLMNPRAPKNYNKEYFEENITIETLAGNIKAISFKNISEKEVDKALNVELACDWMIYRDCNGKGIRALMDAKTFHQDMADYQKGGSPVYEFARFERKLYEHKQGKELASKESAQEAFRNSIVQQAAAEIARQQIALGQNPMELVNLLFAPQDFNYAIQKMIDKPISTPLIEDKKKEKKKIKSLPPNKKYNKK